MSYGVTSIFQDGCRDVAILLPISFLVISLD